MILILVHQFGHFIVAKNRGVRVDEFGLGFPPKIFGKKYGETEYTLNLIPFGGFVKIFGENPDDESLSGKDKNRALVNKPKIAQVAIISAGVFFNILFAWVLLSVGFISGLPTPVSLAPDGAVVENAHLTIVGVEPSSPAEEAGILVGDKIFVLSSGDDVVQEPTVIAMQEFIDGHGDSEIEIVYSRDNVIQSLVVTPTDKIVDGRFIIGVGMDVIGTVSLPVHRAFWEGGKMTIILTGAVLTAFGKLISGIFSGTADISALTGPVGIIGIVGDAASFGFVYLLSLTAIISINLAVINILPFPALDGGRLLFLLIETIKGSPINPKIANSFHAIGFFMLIALIIAVTYNDIIKLIVG